jgi:hypothetical protein
MQTNIIHSHATGLASKLVYLVMLGIKKIVMVCKTSNFEELFTSNLG